MLRVLCQKVWQIRMADGMPDRMPKAMPNRMPKALPDRMSETLCDVDSFKYA